MSAKYDPTDGRLRGRALQARRLRMWTKVQGKCAMCGKLTDYPDSFQLDHINPVHKAGEDLSDEAVQVLCTLPDGSGGCHAKKTAKDLGLRVRQECDAEGWPA